MENNQAQWMAKWQKDFNTYFSIYNTFILEGFVDDVQPYIGESGEVEYCPISEYFEHAYKENEEQGKNKVVIVYDPTEASDMRFKICADSEDTYEPFDETENQEGADSDNTRATSSNRDKYKVTKNFAGCRLAQRFWDILHDEEIDKLLIDHKSAGPSLDFSKIHYAITENTTRLADEILRRIKGFFRRNEIDSWEPDGYIFVIKMTSRLLSRDGESNGLSDDELMIFRQLLSIAQSLESDENANGKSKLVILANQAKDLPMWFVDEINNPFIKVLNIAKPSEENKISFFRRLINDNECVTDSFVEKYQEVESNFRATNDNANAQNAIEKKFIAYTNDFSMRTLLRYKEYLKEHPLEEPSKVTGFFLSSEFSESATSLGTKVSLVVSALRLSRVSSPAPSIASITREAGARSFVSSLYKREVLAIA